MKSTQINAFAIVGIKTRTTNVDMQAAKDIPALWEKFMSENISDKIPNKLDDKIYAVYTNYESDYMGAYDMYIGCKVDAKNEISTDLIKLDIPESSYEEFIAEGKLNDGIVYNKWMEIWKSDLDRRYSADFEVYQSGIGQDEETKVSVLIATK